MNVLFATDGSASSEQARALIASISWPTPTHIEVLYVDQFLDGDLDLPAGKYAAEHEKIRQETDTQLASVKRALTAAGRDIETTLLLGGRPASVIVDEAQRTKADLVIVGSHGRGPFASALIGSVAAEVVDHAPCPVLVARRPALGGVVLADDGSDGAKEAEQLIARSPFLRGAPLRTVTVYSLTPLYSSLEPGAFIGGDVYQELIDDLAEDADRTAADAKKRLAALGVTVTAEVREGNAAQEIIAAANDARADLIVIGSRGRTGLQRLLLGSVARNVLFHAPCSVLLVRAHSTKTA